MTQIKADDTANTFFDSANDGFWHITEVAAFQIPGFQCLLSGAKLPSSNKFGTSSEFGQHQPLYCIAL
jgi:hypothetical protein